MIKLYSSRAAERILCRYAGWIETLSSRYSIPVPIIQAVLFQEIIHMDLFDPLVDLLVRLNWQRLFMAARLRGRRLSSVPGRKKKGRDLLHKLDSSTGYGQIFASVAINAVNFARDRGLIRHLPKPLTGDRRLKPDDPVDLFTVWRLLKRNVRFNLELSTLNLLSAAEETCGRPDFALFTPEEIKRVFTRYNGTCPTISPYGEETYRHYLRYLHHK